MVHRDKIIELYNQGKTRVEICEILSCSRSTVCYHLTETQKQKSYKRNTKNRAKLHPLIMKIDNFQRAKQGNGFTYQSNVKRAIYAKINFFLRKTDENMEYTNFTFEDLINKIGTHPTCYLTGVDIDLNQPNTYSLDHIIPKSRGGSNSLDNLGICTKEANMAKSDLLLDEFISLCKSVVDNQSKLTII